MYERDYAYTKRCAGRSVDQVTNEVREALAAEGFGVLTEIDVQATLKKKLGIDRPPYVILGACNPSLAHRALEVEPPLGVFLPCNLTVFEGEDGATWVQAIKPGVMFGLVENKAVEPIAAEVGQRLERVLNTVAK